MTPFPSTSSSSSSSSSNFPTSSSSSLSSTSSMPTGYFVPPRMTRYSISAAIAEGRAESVVAIGKSLKNLNVNNILACLQLELEEGGEPPFESIEDDPAVYASTALAYINIYWQLERDLAPKDFALALQSFLLDHSKTLIYIGVLEGHDVILDKCAELWALAYSKVLPQFGLHGMTKPDLIAETKKLILRLEFGTGLEGDTKYIEPETLRALGRLLKAMGLADDKEILSDLVQYLFDDNAADELEIWLATGKEPLVTALHELIEPAKDNPTVFSVIDSIDVAKKRFNAKKTALQALGWSDRFTRQVLHQGYRIKSQQSAK